MVMTDEYKLSTYLSLTHKRKEISSSLKTRDHRTLFSDIIKILLHLLPQKWVGKVLFVGLFVVCFAFPTYLKNPACPILTNDNNIVLIHESQR